VVEYLFFVALVFLHYILGWFYCILGWFHCILGYVCGHAFLVALIRLIVALSFLFAPAFVLMILMVLIVLFGLIAISMGFVLLLILPQK